MIGMDGKQEKQNPFLKRLEREPRYAELESLLKKDKTNKALDAFLESVWMETNDLDFNFWYDGQSMDDLNKEYRRIMKIVSSMWVALVVKADKG